jgi:uncharacterized membrane protein
MGARDFLGGVAVGAGLVYFLDAEQGEERRARLRGGFGAARTGRYGSRLGDIDGLEAANLVEFGRLARLAGGALAAYGLLRRGRVGGLLRTLGLGLATSRGRRAVASAVKRGERRRTIDIQRTLYVDAPLDRVYAFGTSFENLPRFLSNVREVRDLGGGRSRWVVEGPDGEAVAWNALVTEREANRLLAWRSEPGALLDNAGVIRFGEEGSGTRIDFRFCYSPPGGRARRAMAEFFGADPRARMNEDLARLKSLLESTIRSDSHG